MENIIIYSAASVAGVGTTGSCFFFFFIVKRRKKNQKISDGTEKSDNNI